VLLMNFTEVEHTMLPAIKDLLYREMTLMSLLFLIELNAFFSSLLKPHNSYRSNDLHTSSGNLLFSSDNVFFFILLRRRTNVRNVSILFLTTRCINLFTSRFTTVFFFFEIGVYIFSVVIKANSACVTMTM